MPQSPRIATCSYCGTRAALVLDRGRHELSCGSCGAPLHEMKMMPVSGRTGRKSPVPRERVWVDWQAERRHALGDAGPYRPDKPRKRRKSLRRKMLSELWDAVEDIFD